MKPTEQSIEDAAFRRWEARGRRHGFDRQDWLSAEREERFAANYRVVALDRLDSETPRSIGQNTRRRCRFCGSTVTAARPTRIYPETLGGGPLAFDQCEDCVAAFAEGVDESLATFLDALIAASDGSPMPAGAIPVASFKGLVRRAISVMPPAALDEHEETIDWVGNPDHELDLGVFRDLACVAHLCERPHPGPWAALASRTAEDEVWPSHLFFMAVGRVILQVAIPLGRGDDDLDVPASTLPDVLPPSPFGTGYDPVARVRLPVGFAEAARLAS